MKIEYHRFKREVSVMDMLLFKPDVPETYTKSAFVNHFLTLFHKFHQQRGYIIAWSMEISPQDLSTVLNVLAGVNFSDFRYLWECIEIEAFALAGVRYSKTQLARHLGYKNCACLWRFLHTKEYARQKAAYRSLLEKEPRAKNYVAERTTFIREMLHYYNQKIIEAKRLKFEESLRKWQRME